MSNNEGPSNKLHDSLQIRNTEKRDGELRRSLQARHLNMIAIGGAIGTGLFLACGNAVSSAGPGGALLAFAVMGMLVYFMMQSLGEMATLIPSSGSFETYATKFIDPALGFALGWNYWVSWSTTVAAELAASALIMKFWFPNIPGLYWSILFLAILFTLNVLSARSFGEAEYWFAGIKVATVIIFLVVGVLMIFGILGGTAPGFSNWVVSDGKGNTGPFIGGAAAICIAFFTAGFSFQGTELVGIATGESENPEVNVPKAIKNVFWRILLFYIGAIIVIGFLIPWTEPNLLKSGAIQDVAISPFTLVFQKTGIAFAASLMNAVILTSVLSAGNSGLYASTRILYSMAKNGKAPKMFTKVSAKGVPVYALMFTTLVGTLCFLSSFVGDGTIYTFLVSVTGVAGFITWIGISACHYRFRKAYIAQGGKVEDLKFKAKWYPFGPIVAGVLTVLVICGMNLSAFTGDKIDWVSVIFNYVGVPIFLLAWLGYKIVKKTKVVPLMEVDFSMDETNKESK
ncbi:amino acid permease [Clostridium aciditolerans]|uniref:Amino acid permease n=1 Tax=Clostridium aciditolerans TaxID=339861 RepID=A0A934M8Y2_9CLOT|nr:amino acid permease [Clostridium aciditolerans]MBI6875296.1 amino acid permease [Clostridium aciditolerans]